MTTEKIINYDVVIPTNPLYCREDDHFERFHSLVGAVTYINEPGVQRHYKIMKEYCEPTITKTVFDMATGKSTVEKIDYTLKTACLKTLNTLLKKDRLAICEDGYIFKVEGEKEEYDTLTPHLYSKSTYLIHGDIIQILYLD